MELCLLLLPIAVLLGLGWTHFPVLTGVFFVYLAGFGIREVINRRKAPSAS